MTKKNTFTIPSKPWDALELALNLTSEEVAQHLTIEKMEAYINAELNDEDAAALYPEVDFLLDTSVEYTDLYTRLYETILAEKEGRLPLIDHQFSKPVLPLNSVPATSDKVSLADKLKAAIVEEGRRLILNLSADLNSLLKPQQADLVLMGENELGDKLMALKVDDKQGYHSHFNLTVYQNKQNPDVCFIEVEVKIPGRNPFKQDGVIVSLKWPNEEQQATSDKMGAVLFKDVPLNQLDYLTLEIESPT